MTSWEKIVVKRTDECPTHKIRFRTKERALKRANCWFDPTTEYWRAYFCRKCGYWHLTSQKPRTGEREDR